MICTVNKSKYQVISSMSLNIELHIVLFNEIKLRQSTFYNALYSKELKLRQQPLTSRVRPGFATRVHCKPKKRSAVYVNTARKDGYIFSINVYINIIESV